MEGADASQSYTFIIAKKIKIDGEVSHNSSLFRMRFPRTLFFFLFVLAATCVSNAGNAFRAGVSEEK